MVNDKICNKFKQTDIDESELPIDISDHSLISIHFSLDRKAEKSEVGDEEDNYY